MLSSLIMDGNLSIQKTGGAAASTTVETDRLLRYHQMNT